MLPHICTPPVHSYAPCTFVHPPYVHMPPRGVHNPPGPPMLSVLLHGFGALHVVGVFFCLMCIGTHHPYLGVPPLNYTPTLHCWFSVHFYSQGYQFLCGPSPSMEGFGGVPPSLGWLGGTSAFQLFICSFFL